MAIHEEIYTTNTPIQQNVELSRFRVDTLKDLKDFLKDWGNRDGVQLEIKDIFICFMKLQDKKGYSFWTENEEGYEENEKIYKSIEEGIEKYEAEGINIKDNITDILIYPVVSI